MSTNWIKKGNQYNYQLSEREILPLKVADKQRTVARQLQEMIAKYPEDMTDDLWAQWALVRHLLVDQGDFVPRKSYLPNHK